jgi:hypothetical protein
MDWKLAVKRNREGLGPSFAPLEGEKVFSRVYDAIASKLLEKTRGGISVPHETIPPLAISDV